MARADRAVRGALSPVITDQPVRAADHFTADEFLEAITAQKRCAQTGRAFSYANGRADRPSPDRIDPDGHYSMDNVQWVTVGWNQAKGRSSDHDFLELCRDVVNEKKGTNA